MSEIKRVALSTLEPQKVSDKVNKKSCKTIRISVILPESNEDKCPEYNYKDQLAAVKKRHKQHKETNHAENGFDPLADDDADVRRLALEMEAKYGAGMKKKRKGRKDDYADIGMGYDESDSFIDNTDGYDEIIPQNVTTLHGGFYINCGALEFKTDDEASSEVSSSSSDSEDEDKAKPASRKRVLDTTDESESDTASSSQIEKKPKINSSNKNTMQQAIKKKLFSQKKIQVKKRRQLIDPLKKTVKELLREKREDLNMSVPSELNKDETLIEDQMEKDSLKENKKPMSITSITDAIESVVKQTGDVELDSNQIKHNNDVNKSNDFCVKSEIKSDFAEPPSSVEGESSQDGHKTDKVEVKLPENLAPDILEVIETIKKAALDYKGEGIKKFFTDEINSLLLSLERKSKTLGKSSRVKVYEHLSFFIKCRRETISRRAKNLILEDEEKKLKKLTYKLKDCISQIMPSLIADHEKESQRIITKKFSKESINNEENKALKMPRKSFRWTEETRKLVKGIVSIKKKCLLLEGKQKNNLDEQVTQFLKSQIVPLWPYGWVHLNTLLKVSNTMTDNSKQLSDSNETTLDSSTKLHSSITITPVPTIKPEPDIPEDITMKIIKEIVCTNVDRNQVKIKNVNSQPVAAKPDYFPSSIKEMEKGSHDARKPHTTPVSVHKEAEKMKHNSEQEVNKVSKPHSSEKDRHNSDHDYRKTVTKTNVIQSTNEKDHEGIRKHPRPDHEIKKEPSRHHRENDLLKIVDSGVIVKNTHKEEISRPIEDKREPGLVISPTEHCQLIDLTDKKPKVDDYKPFDLTIEATGGDSKCVDLRQSSGDLLKASNSRDAYGELKRRQSEINFMPNMFCTSTPRPPKSDGDDIQMVMENLKALQKLSSPVKADNSTGSPVSVIAYNKGFSPKSNSSQGSTGQRADFAARNDFSGTFRDEFQQQFINSLQQLAASSNSNKPGYNRCS